MMLFSVPEDQVTFYQGFLSVGQSVTQQRFHGQEGVAGEALW